MLQLFQFLNGIQPLEEELQAYLIGHLQHKRLEAGENWIRLGQVCSSVAFIEEGLVKSTYKRKGKSYIHWFLREQDVMIAVGSFFEQLPSRETIVAIEPTSLYYIDFATFKHLFRRYESFQWIAIILLTRYYMQSVDRTSLVRLLRSDRFLDFMRSEKELVPRLSQRDIAMYLGLSEEHLSRLRALLFPSV